MCIEGAITRNSDIGSSTEVYHRKISSLDEFGGALPKDGVKADYSEKRSREPKPMPVTMYTFLT